MSRMCRTNAGELSPQQPQQPQQFSEEQTHFDEEEQPSHAHCRAANGQVKPATAGGTVRPCYLLPLRWENHKGGLAELTSYLQQLSARCDVLVVDGSPPPVFKDHHRHWAAFTSHIFPAPDLAYRNGKVNGVITGMPRQLRNIVVPQNYFNPLPWHAAWDSARILLNRGLGMDYPCTVAVRRAAFLAAGCYDGDVLFENLELMRTLRANGARLVTAPDVVVRRLPSDFRHFAGQRIRQAYDSLAQPPRQAAELALLLAVALAVVTRRSWLLAGVAGAAVALAEVGRRRHGGTAVFPWYLPLLAPLWLAERAVCSWLALGSWLRGGVCYRGQRLPRAATSTRVLHRRAVALSTKVVEDCRA